jgi:putative membrane protein
LVVVASLASLVRQAQGFALLGTTTIAQRSSTFRRSYDAHSYYNDARNNNLHKLRTTPSPQEEHGANAAAAASTVNADGDDVLPHQGGGSLDSLEHFASDVSKVLNDLRCDVHDPTLPSYFRHREAKLPAFTYMWSHEDWDRHTSRKRYIEWIANFPGSRLLRRVAPQLAVLVAWSAVAVGTTSQGHFVLFQNVKIDLTPLSLVSTFVGFLLTLRSNQGLSRLGDGRLAFGQVVLYTRDMAHVIAADIYPKNPQVGLLLARHLAIFAWLLKLNLRGERVNGSDHDIISCMIPDRVDAAFILRARKKPVAIVQRFRQVFAHLGEELSDALQHGLDQKTRSLNHCIMTCERILASPIPPLYTAHAGRLLIFYLLCLPFGLRDSLGKVGTVVTTAVVGYAMLGLDEVSHLLEQPFRLMPLYQLSKNSMLDVADAFCVPPPVLTAATERGSQADEVEDENLQESSTPDPCYWPRVS